MNYEGSLIGYHFLHRLHVVVDSGKYIYRRNENYVKVKST